MTWTNTKTNKYKDKNTDKCEYKVLQRLNVYYISEGFQGFQIWPTHDIWWWQTQSNFLNIFPGWLFFRGYKCPPPNFRVCFPNKIRPNAHEEQSSFSHDSNEEFAQFAWSSFVWMLTKHSQNLKSHIAWGGSSILHISQAMLEWCKFWSNEGQEASECYKRRQW